MNLCVYCDDVVEEWEEAICESEKNEEWAHIDCYKNHEMYKKEVMREYYEENKCIHEYFNRKYGDDY